MQRSARAWAALEGIRSQAAVALPVSLAILVAGVLAISAAVGVVESITARLRLPTVPLYIAAAAALSGFGLVLVVR